MAEGEDDVVLFIEVELVVVCEERGGMMLCSRPYLKAPSGFSKDAVILSEDARLASTPFPCGRCMSCKINKARMWSHRILLEANEYDFSSFVTLTYDDKHLPDPPHVRVTHLQNFLKRLRNRSGRRFRYYGVGEYGSRSYRPHYHVVLFGMGLDTHSNIRDSWRFCDPKFGVHIGELNKDSARYITGYVTKKYTDQDPVNYGKRKEFALMSKQEGGIGYPAIKRMAETISKNPMYDGNIIRELKYGKTKRMPLGRYLTQKMAEELQISPSKIQEEFWEYQQEMLDKHLENGTYFYDSIVNEKRQERINKETRFKIYRSRRSL